jgi:alkyl hydroperoxide reductase subunit AhpC
MHNIRVRLNIDPILGVQLCSPRVQQPAPDFHGTAVVNQEFKEISLADYKGKYLVLFFYPLDL